MDNRRDFLVKLAGLTASVAFPLDLGATGEVTRDRLGELLPLRKLGRTGTSVTMLGVGGYHIHWTSERDAQQVIMTALERGIRFFDTAESYGPHVSEIKYGKFLTPKYRDVVFLMTKTTARDAKTAREHLEGSLKRMKTDYLDLWQVHSLSTPEDVDERIRNGVLDVFLEARESGKVKYIGFTGHQNPKAHLRMFEATRGMDIWDTVQMPVNPVDAASANSFVREVIPVASASGVGILAMKTLADGRFFARKNHHDWQTDHPLIPDRITIADAMNFAWSLPISTLITGAEMRPFLEEKIELAGIFRGISEQERLAIVDRVSDLSKYGSMEYYKRV